MRWKFALAGWLWLALLLHACGSAAPVPAPDAGTEQRQTAGQGAEASAIRDVRFASKALGRDMGFTVYLPPGYDESKRYPVLYLLYGYGGDQRSWFDYLGLGTAADELIRAGRIAPLLIVAPDYGNSFGADTEPGQGRNPGGVSEGQYGEYLARELPDYIDAHYATVASREGRYVGGASMGGFAALHLAFRYPERFGKAGAHSAALWDFTGSDLYADQRDWLLPTPQLRDERDPFRLAERPEARQVAVYLDCGESDPLAAKDKEMYDKLQALGFRAEWHPAPGGHDMNYWAGHVRDYLLFYAGAGTYTSAGETRLGENMDGEIQLRHSDV